MPICRFCGLDKKLIKAHVIPEAFFRRLRDGQDPPRMLTSKEGEYPKRMPIGEYDPDMLCDDCERQFGEWDGYAQELLGEEPKDSSPIVVDGETVAYEIKEYNYRLLKLFFISLLWRASVSVRPFYARISVGTYEEAAKNLIEIRDPGSEYEFSVLIGKFDHPIGKTILDPHRDRYDGVNYCRFYLGSYVVYIKTDQRRNPEPFPALIMKPGQPLYIIGRDILKSKELPVLVRMVSDPKNRFLKQMQSD
jgi:hypothetical protein